jgi:hypothetical protein
VTGTLYFALGCIYAFTQSAEVTKAIEERRIPTESASWIWGVALLVIAACWSWFAAYDVYCYLRRLWRD